MKKKIKLNFLKNSGSSLIEYSIISSILAILAVVALILVSSRITESFEAISRITN